MFSCPVEAKQRVVRRLYASGEQLRVKPGVIAGEEHQTFPFHVESVTGDDALVLALLEILDGFSTE